MHVSQINVYPIKSLKGITVDSAVVENRGLQFDRRWMLVDENRKFLTQRELPTMATISIVVREDSLEVEHEGRRLEIPGQPTVAGRNVSVWTSSVKAAFYSSEIDDWFSNVLGIKCQLAVMTATSKRPVNPFYAVRKFKDEVSFADGYPFLIANEASLDDLNDRLGSPVPMNRFRPNFVITGAPALAEDEWKKIRIGSTLFHVVKSCERCVITTVDQASGTKTGPEPLRTLASYRTKRGKVLFGRYLIVDTPGSTIRVRDPIDVVA